MTLLVGWARTEKVLQFDLVFPPTIVASTSADHLWAALFRHNQPVFHARAKMFQTARYAVDLNETDAAYADKRLYAFLYSRSCENVLPLWIPRG